MTVGKGLCLASKHQTHRMQCESCECGRRQVRVKAAEWKSSWESAQSETKDDRPADKQVISAEFGCCIVCARAERSRSGEAPVELDAQRMQPATTKGSTRFDAQEGESYLFFLCLADGRSAVLHFGSFFGCLRRSSSAGPAHAAAGRAPTASTGHREEMRRQAMLGRWRIKPPNTEIAVEKGADKKPAAAENKSRESGGGAANGSGRLFLGRARLLGRASSASNCSRAGHPPHRVHPVRPVRPAPPADGRHLPARRQAPSGTIRANARLHLPFPAVRLRCASADRIRSLSLAVISCRCRSGRVQPKPAFQQLFLDSLELHPNRADQRRRRPDRLRQANRSPGGVNLAGSNQSPFRALRCITSATTGFGGQMRRSEVGRRATSGNRRPDRTRSVDHPNEQLTEFRSDLKPGSAGGCRHITRGDAAVRFWVEDASSSGRDLVRPGFEAGPRNGRVTSRAHGGKSVRRWRQTR